MTYYLKSQVALITGANQGLGAVVAEEFVKRGASVYLGARDLNLLGPVIQKLKTLAQNLNSDEVPLVEGSFLDLADQASMTNWVSQAFKIFPQVHTLVNNAALLGPAGPFDENNWHEWTQTIQVNLLGTAFLTQKLLPHFKSFQRGVIINIAGGGATAAFPNFSAYAVSKVGIVRLTENLAEEYKDFGITVNAVSPGVLKTRIMEQTLAAGPDKIGKAYFQKIKEQRQSGGAPPEKAAELCCYLASGDARGISGKVISAVWDDWSNLHTHADDLQKSDIYTLRRILPSERCLSWH